jgi:Neuraminidase (sialidase)
MKNQKEKIKGNLKLNFILSAGLIVLLSSCNSSSEQKEKVPDNNIQHGIVFYEEGRFCGWPANNGIWSWGNEILVGFVEAAYKDSKGFHTYDPTTAINKYARSKDGGETWTIEDAYKNGQTAGAHDHNISEEKVDVPVSLNEAVKDFTNPDFILTFLRQNNHNGPSHFYYSNNRGANWEGPFIFPNLNTNGVVARTDYIIDGKKELNAFLTVAKSNEKEGRVAMSRTTDGGLNWEIVSWIGPEPEGFEIMPSSLRLSPDELITVIRKRTKNGLDLLTSYLSEDNGKTWEKLKNPVADAGRGGSPPALVKMKDGRLALAYIYRSEYGSRVNIRFSSNNGRKWSDEIILRCCDGATFDVGYPRMVQRPDGKLVIIYYWNNANQEGAKPYRYIASTIVDPDQWK